MNGTALPNATLISRLRMHENALVLELRGDLGSLRWQRRDEMEGEVLRALARRPCPVVVIDLSEVRFGGSEFVAFLLRLKKRLRLFDCDLVLARAQRAVLQVIQLLRLDRLLPHYDTVEGAVAAASTF